MQEQTTQPNKNSRCFLFVGFDRITARRSYTYRVRCTEHSGVHGIYGVQTRAIILASHFTVDALDSSTDTGTGMDLDMDTAWRLLREDYSVGLWSWLESGSVWNHGRPESVQRQVFIEN